MRWEVSERLSAKESAFVRRLNKGGRFYLFLREVRTHSLDTGGGFGRSSSVGMAKKIRFLAVMTCWR